ncbi:hypothetical protein [Streptomyces bauhiniae]|uniref:Tail terminator n=1 Tax=Streptomyces bauhiniae TaxID=2340725 RepID=A0A7K3QRB9_9ACTN|nr:hypothetical protein [Streptomyces bauhiniae]NEB92447.1 hypothetical protein [Streptomyces bauhiniae]
MPVPVTPEVLPHVDAVQGALEAVGLTVYVGGAPATTGWTAPDKYCVLYPEPGTAVRESLADQRTDFETTMTITCVGSDWERVLWATDRVRRALAAPLVVDGRSCWPPEDRGGPPLARDDDVTPPVYYSPIQYWIGSTPA